MSDEAHLIAAATETLPPGATIRYFASVWASEQILDNADPALLTCVDERLDDELTRAGAPADGARTGTLRVDGARANALRATWPHLALAEPFTGPLYGRVLLGRVAYTLGGAG